MTLNIWTKPSGYNLGNTPGVGTLVSADQLIVGAEYVIKTIGTTDFISLGATPTVTFAGKINGTKLIVAGTSFGRINVNTYIFGLGVTPGTYVTSFENATGKSGLFNLNVVSDVPTESIMNGIQVDAVFKATKPGAGTGTALRLAISERTRINCPLPVLPNIQATFKVISGKLPDGLRIEGSSIVGTPYEVARITDFTFCIRATVGNEFADRTFKLTVEGADAPEFITQAGDLPIGPNQQYYVLDSSYVEYQIEAFDLDTSTGQRLSYFISEEDGQLPPGLMLTTDGRIVGYVQPVLTIKPADGNGFYDTGTFDTVAFDWGYRPTNGFDSFLFDSLIFDYYTAERGPRKLNRNYEFVVSVTDGDTIAKRLFKIFVVSDDYFRADNTFWLNGTGLFTADATYLRAPIWITPQFLGTYRANNYVTLIIDTYDINNVVYNLELVNADITATTLKISENDNIFGSTTLTIVDPSLVPTIGQYFSFNRLFNGGTEKVYQITSVDDLLDNRYRLIISSPLDTVVPNDISFFIGSKSILPPGMNFDLARGEIFGRVPYQPAITTTYSFTITATRLDIKTETAESSRKFTVDIIGEIDSTITWNSDPDLGSINANFISTLSVSASSTIPKAIVLYNVINGNLPPGLTLNLDGEIIGKVNQYSTNSLPGILTFDKSTGITTFDNNETTIDRVYYFTVEASDQYRLSVTTRTFNIRVETPNQLLYSNIRVKPYLKYDQRDRWYDFINDTSIFTPSSIYRPNDPNFGLRDDLSMLIFAGIETTEAAAYIGAIGLNHKRKRFHFGSIKKAVAVIPGTVNQVYEVVYVQMLDPLEPNGKRLPNKLKNLGRRKQPITTDNSRYTSIKAFDSKFNAYSVNTIAGDKVIVYRQTLNSSEFEFNDGARVSWSTTSAIEGQQVRVENTTLNISEPFSFKPDPYMSVDSTGYLISDPNYGMYFPSSISNWRERIRSVGARERNYLPLWMRSIQPGTKREIDFTLAIPLCYCKAGTADDIILNIKYSGFDFKLLDYTADRYIIDAVEGSTADKYLVFRNDRITV